MAPNNALKKSALGDDAETESPEILNNEAPRGVISASEVRDRGDGVNKGAREEEGLLTSELRKFLVAVMFLTRLPCPRWVDHSPKDLVPGMSYFPILGTMVGLWCSLWYDALLVFWDPLVAASASTLAGVWLTGCFHEDGLADTLDSFGGGWGKAQILRIMKDSRVGTYAVVGVALCLISKTALLASRAEDSTRTLVLGHTLARLGSVWMTKLFPYVHDEGDDKGLLYNTFAGCIKGGLLTWKRVLLSTISAVMVCLVACLGANVHFQVRAAIAFVFVVPIVVVLAGRYACGVIGGVIGDFLGATIMLTEIIVYGVLSSKAPWEQGGMWWWPLIRLLLVVSSPILLMRGAGDMPSKEKSC